MKKKFHLAQVNIALLKAPIDDPLLAGFVARLEEINTLADNSSGFIWRLKTEQNDATSIRPYDDDRILINLSIWDTPESLREYVYQSAHSDVMRQRKMWFDKFEGMYYALWWIRRGDIPTIEEAKHRLDHLQKHGESGYSFSFAKIFPMPEP